MTIRLPVWHRCHPGCGALYPQHVLQSLEVAFGVDWPEDGRAMKAQADDAPKLVNRLPLETHLLTLRAALNFDLLLPLLLHQHCGMFAFLRSSEAGLSSGPPGVAHSDNQKDLVNPAESVIAGQDSDSNVNPGELTFEEGESRLTVFSASQRFDVGSRYSWWDGTPFGGI
jgi:hypothetical protein